MVGMLTTTAGAVRGRATGKLIVGMHRGRPDRLWRMHWAATNMRRQRVTLAIARIDRTPTDRASTNMVDRANHSVTTRLGDHGKVLLRHLGGSPEPLVRQIIFYAPFITTIRRNT
jgi:hypothetical protein